GCTLRKDEIARDEHQNIVAERLEVIGVWKLTVASKQDQTARLQAFESFGFRDELAGKVVRIELHVGQELLAARARTRAGRRSIISTTDVDRALDGNAAADKPPIAKIVIVDLVPV